LLQSLSILRLTKNNFKNEADWLVNSPECTEHGQTLAGCLLSTPSIAELQESQSQKILLERRVFS